MAPRTDSEQKRLVADGYDAAAEEYARSTLSVEDPAKRHFVDVAIASAPAGGHLIDLGCGTGEDVTVHLHPHFQVKGIDISPRSIELARERAAGPEYLVADMSTAAFAAGSIDVVTAFYSLIHVPRGEHAAMLSRISRWLRAGGTFIATMGATAEECYDDDWFGAPMTWSHWDADTNERLVAEARFAVLASERLTEPGGLAAHLWIVATTDEVALT